MTQNKKNILILLIIVVVLGVLIYRFQMPDSDLVTPTIGQSGSTISGVSDTGVTGPTGDTGAVATRPGFDITIPDDITGYRQRMINHVQVGGPDPLPNETFVTKHIDTPYTGDVRVAAATTAANQVPLGGGPAQATVTYFKVENGTAYIVLNIDEDGRAGVSVALATVHPLVERTLLQYPEIKQVVVGRAPEDQTK